MNYSILFKLHSFILGALSIAFALSLGIALMEDNASRGDLAVTGFSFSLLAASSLALGFWILGRTGTNTLYHKEALATIGTGWLLASIVGALPYILILPDLSPAEAFFESASGLTTTGASILSDLERLPRSLHFWRAISQWIGGLGVVVFFVAVLSFLGAGAKVLYSRESSAEAADLNASRVQEGVLRLLKLYLGLSFLCILAYRFCGLSWFESVIHMFTSLSTGGFSTRSGSIADFANPAFEWTVILFMAIGGTSFLLMTELLRRHWRNLLLSTEFRTYVLLIFVFTGLISLFLFLDSASTSGLHDTVRSAAFQVVSIMTTTGYATADFAQWLPVNQVLLVALMFIGGCSGSTAGGTKVIRFIVAARVALHHVEKAYHTRVIRPLEVNGKSLSRNEQDSIIVYIVILGLVVFASTLLVALLQPSMSFEGIISTMAACLFNIGPGLAEIGPTENFSGLHGITQVFLSLLMITGRLELYAILVLFSPALWKHF
ncbi:MAG: TrkH family potassium uptake protein [Oceanipulchritudo sp.]